MLRCSGRSYLDRYTVILVSSRDCSHITWSRNSASVSLLATETTIHRDIIYLRDQIYKTNSNRKRSDLITKSDDSVDMRRRIFSDDNNIREQSKRYCSDQKFSISRTNQAHRYSNSLHQRKNDRRIHRFNLRVCRSNDSWRFDKITNQRQICSISRRSKNRIIIVSTKRLATTICENLSTLFATTISENWIKFAFDHIISSYIIFDHCWMSISHTQNVSKRNFFVCTTNFKKCNSDSISMRAKQSSSHLITSFLSI
jgi:hypothetical protein